MVGASTVAYDDWVFKTFGKHPGDYATAPDPNATGTASDPAATAPDPAGAAPDPAATAPDQAATAPDPTATAPDPAATTPDPATTAPDPAATTPDPATTAPDPAATTPDPATTAPDPAATAPDPATTAPDPAAMAPDPAATAPDPAATAPDPAAAAPDPAATAQGLSAAGPGSLDGLTGDGLAADALNTSVTTAGAPPVPPAADLDAPAMAATDQDVFFTRNSAALTPSDSAALGAYADRYIKAAVPTPIRVDGYASLDGDAATNKTLAQQRADAVKAYLSGTKGIKPELITAVGNGATSQFPPGTPAPNRRAVFGPPVKDGPAKPDAGTPDPAKPDAGTPDPAKPGPQKASTQVTPTPDVPVTHEEAEKIFGADMLAQWNAVRGKGGPVPASGQLSLTLTLNGTILPKDKSKPVSKDNFKLEWLADPSIAVVFNSSGPPANDQETISVFKASWKNTILKLPVEASVLAVTQNLFTSGASPQVGGQPQIKGKINDQLSVVVGGTFMFGKSDAGKFGFNPAGFLGLDVTLF